MDVILSLGETDNHCAEAYSCGSLWRLSAAARKLVLTGGSAGHGVRRTPGVAAGQETTGKSYCAGCSRHSRGEAPNLCLKIRLKWARSLKPHANAMSPMCLAAWAGSDRSRLHRSRRWVWT